MACPCPQISSPCKDASVDSRSSPLGACRRSSTGSPVLLGRRGLCQATPEVKAQATSSRASGSRAKGNYHCASITSRLATACLSARTLKDHLEDNTSWSKLRSKSADAVSRSLVNGKHTGASRSCASVEPVGRRLESTPNCQEAAYANGQEMMDKEDDVDDECSTIVDVRSDESEDSNVEVDDTMVQKALMIFDWDDTLCPSSWLKHFELIPAKKSQYCFAPSQKQREQLDLVAERAAELLRRARLLGEVVIITSAQQGWVELSCKKFLSGLWPELATIRVISARSSFERTVKSPSGWKVHAFQNEMDRCFADPALRDSHRIQSFMSIGDGLDERHALLTVCGGVKGCFAKSVKLIDSPDPVELHEQHLLLTNSLERLAKHEGDIDLSLKGN